MANSEKKMRVRHNLPHDSPREPTMQPFPSKSDMNMPRSSKRCVKESDVLRGETSCVEVEHCGESRRKTKSVIDEAYSNLTAKLSMYDAGNGDHPLNVLTDSTINGIELKLKINPTHSTVSLLDTHLKCFKTKVEEIFKNFFSQMKDFEEFKAKFNDIIAKNMDFSIDDSYVHLPETLKSQPSISNLTSSSINHHSFTISEVADVTTICEPWEVDSINVFDQHPIHKEEVLTNFLEVFVQGVTNRTNIRSEMSFASRTLLDGIVPSAENLQVIAAKRQEIRRYLDGSEGGKSEREIPVKICNPKKDIYLDEDFQSEKPTKKSFMSKLCNYLCKKLRGIRE